MYIITQNLGSNIMKAAKFNQFHLIFIENWTLILYIKSQLKDNINIINVAITVLFHVKCGTDFLTYPGHKNG